MTQKGGMYTTSVTNVSGTLTKCIRRIRADDSLSEEAEDELFACVMDQLREKARQILLGFPSLRGKLEPDQVVNGAYEQLHRQLASRDIKDRQHFFRIACRNFRWWLLDYLKHVKRRRTRAPLGSAANDIPGTTTSVSGKIGTAELAEWAATHLESLEKQYRDVIDCHLFLDMSFREIGEELGIAHTTAKHRWDRGIEMLRTTCTATKY